MDSQCFICHASCHGSLGKDGNLTDFKRSFDLFCKLLKVEGLLGSPEEFGGDDKRRVETCELCKSALQEILRLERVINELKISQMVHVNTLKRCLLLATTSSSSSFSKGGDFWNRTRSQLINCLTQKKKEPVAKRTLPFSRPPSKSVDNSSSTLKSKPRPCTVRLIRLKPDNLTLSSSEPEPDTSRRSHLKRQSKLKAEKFLQDHQNDHLDLDDDELPEKPELDVDPNWFEDDDDDDPLQDSLSPEPPAIKQEPIDHDEEICKEPQQKYPGTMTMTTSQPSTRACRRKSESIFYLQEHTYLYKCSIILYNSPSYLCQEPNCLNPSIPGTILNGSLFTNLKHHVNKFHLQCHIDFGLLRTCPLCSKQISGPPNIFRSHLIAEHCSSKKRGLETKICEICGQPVSVAQMERHLWSHKSGEEMQLAIQLGEKVPYKIKRKLKLKDEPLKEGEPQLKLRRIMEATMERGNYIFVISQGTKLLIDYSVINLEQNGYRLVCGEQNCGKVFEVPDVMEVDSNLEAIKQHIRTFHGFKEEFNRKCPDCPLEFENGKQLRNHLLKNHGDNQDRIAGQFVLCPKCGITLRKPELLKHAWSHMNPQEKVEWAETSGEKRGFVKNELNEQARKIKEGLEPEVVKCPDCGRLFGSILRLKAHQPVHWDKDSRRKWTCDQCGDLFLSRIALTIHKDRVHTPKEEIRWRWCSVQGCHKKFYWRDVTRYRSHVKSHKGVGNEEVMCEICGKGFWNKYKLNDHLKVHKKERGYPCQFCEKSYKCANHRNRHVRIKHPEEI